MADHPLNLALRFFLEMAALWLLAGWGWGHEPRALGVTLAVLTFGTVVALHCLVSWDRVARLLRG